MRASTRWAIEVAAPSIGLPRDATTAELAMSIALVTRLGLRTVERALGADPEWAQTVRSLTVKTTVNLTVNRETPGEEPPANGVGDRPDSAHTYLHSLRSTADSAGSTAGPAALPELPIDPKALARQVLGKNKVNRYPATCPGGHHVPEGLGFYAVPFQDDPVVYCLACLFGMASLDLDSHEPH